MEGARGPGRGNGESAFNGDGVSISDNEKVVEMMVVWWHNVNVLNPTELCT